MASDHVRRPHPWGYDADCPGCRETCNCGELVRKGILRECVHCRLVVLGVKP